MRNKNALTVEESAKLRELTLSECADFTKVAEEGDIEIINKMEKILKNRSSRACVSSLKMMLYTVYMEYFTTLPGDKLKKILKNPAKWIADHDTY